MNTRELLQQLFLLKQDIESTPMLDSLAAQQRNQWAVRLGDLLNRVVEPIEAVRATPQPGSPPNEKAQP